MLRRKSSDKKPAPAPAGLHRKPRPDLYTVFLVIALIAVLLGILFLYLEMQLYEFKMDGGGPLGQLVGGLRSVASVSVSQTADWRLLIPNP